MQLPEMLFDIMEKIKSPALTSPGEEGLIGQEARVARRSIG